MENSVVLNMNYEEMLSGMNYEQIAELQEKIKERRISELDRRVVIAEEQSKQLQKELERVIIKLDDAEGKIECMAEDFKELTTKTSQITDTLMSNSVLKRKLENKIHSVIYSRLPKYTLRGQLFHGCLSKACKGHLTSTLQVNKFDLIMQEDVPMCEKLVSKFLTDSMIKGIMRKDASRLFKLSETSKKDNVKNIGVGSARKFELLDKLLEEVGGDINAI